MSAIVRYTETMSPKERVRRTFEFDKTDRVTIGYEANGAVHMRLSQALGIPDGNMELVYRALGVDYRGVCPGVYRTTAFTAPEGRRVDPVEGYIMRWVPNENGGYWDFCDFPLKDADDEDFENTASKSGRLRLCESCRIRGGSRARIRTVRRKSGCAGYNQLKRSNYGYGGCALPPHTR